MTPAASPVQRRFSTRGFANANKDSESSPKGRRCRATSVGNLPAGKLVASNGFPAGERWTHRNALAPQYNFWRGCALCVAMP
ncbi:hypothetical protein [Nostoc sp.]|uniref:hypothetical protein n=1 Tax=Nostoc sp. TaxID=1180 RepID=UPI002FF5581C